MRLDDREEFPMGLEKYLSMYGWHFSKKLCNFAVSNMRKDSGEKITPITKEALDLLLAKNSIEICEHL